MEGHATGRGRSSQPVEGRRRVAGMTLHQNADRLVAQGPGGQRGGSGELVGVITWYSKVPGR